MKVSLHLPLSFWHRVFMKTLPSLLTVAVLSASSPTFSITAAEPAHIIMPKGDPNILFEADFANTDWFRPVVGELDIEGDADQEFGGVDYEAQRVALDRAGIAWDGEQLVLRGVAGKVSGIEIPARILKDLPPASDYIVGVEMRLTDLSMPGYYLGPRMNRGTGRGVQRFLGTEMPEWTTVEFIMPNSPEEADTGLRLTHHASRGNWEIRRIYIRPTDVRDDFPWELADAEAGTPVTVTVDPSVRTPMNPLLHGYNPNFGRTGGITFDDPDVKEMLKTSGAQILRFPSGTQSNWYDWEIDGWPQDLPKGIPNFVYDTASQVSAERGTYGLDGYIETVRELDLKPVIVLNILTKSPESMVRWLRHLDEAGVPVEHVELGNETYHHRQANDATATGRQYVEHVRPYVEAIREAFPDVKFSPPAISRQLRADGWTWNEELAEFGGDLFDGITLHTYSHAFGVPFNHEMVIEMLYPDERNVRSHVERKEKFFPGKRIWNTEWNINAPPVMPNDTQLGALQNALYLLALIRNEEHFEMATLHSLSSSPFSPVQFRGRGGAKNSRLRRAFFALELVSDLFTPGGTWLGTKVGDGLPPLEADYGRADAEAGQLPDGSTVIVVVNRLPVARPLRIDGVEIPEGAELTRASLTADRLGDATTVPLGQTLIARGAWKQGDPIPPYSVNRITIPASKPAGTTDS